METLAQLHRLGLVWCSCEISRYFAMDRDKRWERTKLSWDAIVLGEGEVVESSPADAVKHRYEQGETDEFLKPLIFSHPNQQRIRDGDVVFFFNFRADRGRQLARAFLFPDFDGFDRQVQPKVHFVTMTVYDQTYNCPVAFQPQTLDNIREGDHTLLDRTLMLYTTDHGFAKVHGAENVPMITIGSGAGRIKTGMHLHAPGDTMARVGLTLQQAMGVPINSWGTEGNLTARPFTEIIA